jgi:hypothetical protein
MPGDRGSNLGGRKIDPADSRPNSMPSEKSLEALRQRGEQDRRARNSEDDRESEDKLDREERT